MLFDSQTVFSDAQSLVIGNGASVVSTNTLDLGVPGTNAQGGSPTQDPGRGRQLKVFCQVVTAATGASSTLKAQLIMSDNADLSSPVVLEQTDDIAMATLVAGYRFRLGSVPAGVSKRYLGMKYVNGSGSNMTGGAITAALVFDQQDAPTVG